MPLRLLRFSSTAWVLGILFLGFNFLYINDFGESYDELYSLRRGEKTLRFLELYIAGDPDAAKVWRTLRVARYHPTGFATLNFVTSTFLRDRLGVPPIASGHVLPLILSALGVVALILFASRLSYGPFSARPIAVVSGIFLCLSPPYLAHSHFSPKDVPAISLGVIGMLFLLTGRQKRSPAIVIVAGLIQGFALSTNIITVLLLGALACSFLVEGTVSRRSSTWKQWADGVFPLSLLLPYITALVLGVFLTWPFLWINPLLFLTSIHHFEGAFWQGTVLYLGKLYSGSQLPWHYTGVSVFLAVPLVLCLLIPIGIVRMIRTALESPSSNNGALLSTSATTSLLLLWLLLPILVVSFWAEVQYHGLRHVLSILPVLSLLAAIGFVATLERQKVSRRTSLIASVAVTVWLLYQQYSSFPFGASYTNEVVRALFPNDRDKVIELDPFEVSLHQGLQWISKNGERNSKICIPLLAANRGRTLRFQLPNSMQYNCDTPDYYIISTRLRVRFPKLFREYSSIVPHKPVHTISVQGAKLVGIYTR